MSLPIIISFLALNTLNKLSRNILLINISNKKQSHITYHCNSGNTKDSDSTNSDMSIEYINNNISNEISEDLVYFQEDSSDNDIS